MKRFSKGFTVIELLVVVAIVGILAATAYPSYVEYVLRSRRADGKAALLSAILAQEKWRSNNTTYGTLANIGISNTSTDGYYTIAIDGTPSATSYTLTATPVSTDTDCAIFVINQVGKVLSGTYSSKTAADSDCWGK